jgi:tetratricopeptide (TPR) repeat protein
MKQYREDGRILRLEDPTLKNHAESWLPRGAGSGMKGMGRTTQSVAVGLAGILVTVALIAGVGCSHKSVEDYLTAGNTAMQNTRLSEAEQDFQAAVKLAPNDPRPHIALGNLYVFQNKPDQARAEFMTVLELDPNSAPAHDALGGLYFSEQQYPAAESQYRAAVALAPARADYHINLAQALTKENKLSEAEAELRTAIGLQPKNAAAHLALAALLFTEPNRADEARAEYAQAVALNPSLATPTPVSTPAAAMPSAPTSASSPRIKPIDKKFLLTHNSPVYQNPSTGSPVLAQVHRRKYVHVIGITGDWLQIRMRNGTVGFIPTSAAE